MNKYSDNAIAIYKKLYFNRDNNNQLIEKTPEECHNRIAKAIANNDNEYSDFLTMLDERLFRPNSPVLINAGGPKQFLSACYVLGLEDSMDSIIECWGTCAKIYASGAGAGIPLTNLRRKDGPITFGGRASGPLSYTKVLDIYSETVKAGNKARRAANMGMITYNHPDVFELLDCKLDKQTLKNFNLSISIPDEFMEEIIKDKEYTFDLIDPKEGKVSSTSSKKLWDRIINNVWKIGDPGLFFIDTVNKFNSVPSIPINCSNPCGEVPLWPWTECVIGSINVSNLYGGISNSGNKEHFFDWDKFYKTVRLSTIFLDNCIDKTMHPNPKFKNNMLKYRPIGLGIMGFADLLVKMKVPYDSSEAIKLFNHICFALNYVAIKTSIEMCREGKKSIDVPKKDHVHFRNLINFYTKKDKVISKDFDMFGIRNCTWTCIAPTGSISISADCSYSFEPLSAIVWQKELAESHKLMNFVNPEFEKWLEEDIRSNLPENIAEVIVQDNKNIIFNKIINNNGSIQGIKEIPEQIQNIFKTAHDIDPFDKINMQAAGQEWISMAISSTCNLPESATPKDISDIYKYAWTQGLKGITVYRDKSQEWQPINFGKKDCKEEIVIKAEKIDIHYSQPNNKIERPIKRKGETFEIKTPHGRLYCTFNKDNKGRPLEVFLRLGKSGTLENLLLDTISRLVSKNLQNGVPYKDIVALLRGIKEEKFWFRIIEESSEPFSAESIIDAVGLIMEEAFYDNTEYKKVQEEVNIPAIKRSMEIKKQYSLCKECNQYTLDRTSGCRGGMCLNCGFSNCG